MEGTERRSRGTWASDFPDEIQYVRRCILKRRFLMGPPHEYKFTPPPALSRKDRCTLLQPVVEEYSRFLFFLPFHPIKNLNWGDIMTAVMSHPFIPLSTSTIFLLLFSVMDLCIYNERAGVHEHVGQNIKWCQ